MFEAPAFLVMAIKMLAFIASRRRADLGDVTNDGQGEFHSESFGCASWHGDDEQNGYPQFVYSPVGNECIEVSWHRSLQSGRSGVFVNREVSDKETLDMFDHIYDEMTQDGVVTYEKW